MTDLKLLLLHGPNLSQLGTRDPGQYGTATLEAVVALARETAEEAGASLDHEQHEDEGAIIRRLHAARTDGTAGLVINAGAYTHYSYAIRDALEMLDVPKIELHLSNIHARERFRHTSVIAAACDASIAGLGANGYRHAVRAVIELVQGRAT